mmetsp:Transcript_20881/g.43872  ORF Transcript_20881/g.43872 Transcript_20881/m.43872 type:complete len:334 (-) Transcript_20881:589-1590(-)
MVIRRLATAILAATTLTSHAPTAFANGSQPIEIAQANNDEYASASLNLNGSPGAYPRVGITEASHAKIKTILMSAKELMENARGLLDSANMETVLKAEEMMRQAGQMFQEAKGHIHQGRQESMQESMLRGANGGEFSPERKAEALEMARSKYSNHDLAQAKEDEDRAIDIARDMYETFITFPECVEQLFERCLNIINRDLEDLGLSTVEVVVHEKRNINQEGYNKVVIITNELADQVKGRNGEGIVSYPFPWDDTQTGSRMLGVDGKWDCRELSPTDCCNTIKQSVPNKDTRGNSIECHIFVPFGGIGNPRRTDRVFVNLSPDGRVHEPPVIT